MTNNDLECLRMTYNELQWHLGRSCALKKLENAEKVKRGPTDGPTKRGVESRSTRLKMILYGIFQTRSTFFVSPITFTIFSK